MNFFISRRLQLVFRRRGRPSDLRYGKISPDSSEMLDYVCRVFCYAPMKSSEINREAEAEGYVSTRTVYAATMGCVVVAYILEAAQVVDVGGVQQVVAC